MKQEKIINPHDKFFKSVLSKKEHARDFLRHYLPSHINELLDFNSLSIVKDSFIEKELKEYFSDLLYSIDIKGQESFIYLLFEHKSAPDPLTPFQVLRYMVLIWGRLLKQGHIHRKLPIILPIVAYHGVSTWKVGLSFIDLFHISDEALKEYIPDFKYLLCDISHLSDEDIKGAVILKATLLVLKYIFRPDLREHIGSIFGLLNDLSSKQTALEYFETLLRYLVHATDRLDKEDIKKGIMDIPEGGNIMPTIAEQWIEEGFQRGMQQGMQQECSRECSRDY